MWSINVCYWLLLSSVLQKYLIYFPPKHALQVHSRTNIMLFAHFRAKYSFCLCEITRVPLTKKEHLDHTDETNKSNLFLHLLLNLTVQVIAKFVFQELLSGFTSKAGKVWATNVGKSNNTGNCFNTMWVSHRSFEWDFEILSWAQYKKRTPNVKSFCRSIN